jgi:hypothetical protein
MHVHRGSNCFVTAFQVWRSPLVFFCWLPGVAELPGCFGCQPTLLVALAARQTVDYMGGLPAVAALRGTYSRAHCFGQFAEHYILCVDTCV